MWRRAGGANDPGAPSGLKKKRLRDQQKELVRRFATSEVAQDLQDSGFAVGGHGGVVNQMIGDGPMAIFGAPLPLAEAPWSAVRAALDMVEMIELFNAERANEGKTPIAIGVGIASGEVVAGYTGTQQRATYTCVGDTVNLAAQLEAHTKEAARTVLIDGETQSALAGRLATEALGPVQFRGRTAAVEVFAVVAL
jgi:adenylate cyclase